MGIGCSCLSPNEYLILSYPTNKTLRRGPGCVPYFCATGAKRNGITLDQTQYVTVRHMNNTQDNADVLTNYDRPGLFIPNNPFDVISEVKKKIVLQLNEYVIVEDRNGNRSIVEGPRLFTPGPYDRVSEITQKLNLSNTQYIIVTDRQTGDKKTVQGPCVYTPTALETLSQIHNKIILNVIDYVYVTHTQTGQIEIVEGPVTFAPMPFDVVSDIKKKIVLKQFEYIQVVNKNTGIIRVERGPSTIILKPTEERINDVQTALEINQDTAAYIFNTDTGAYDLIQITKDDESFMFVPSPTQKVIEVRQRIKLQDFEAMILTDKNGKYVFMRGDNGTGSFFLPPYCKILTQEWSIDLEKKKTEVMRITNFNLRPQYMDFQFPIRTKDNVVIEIELNFYWQIVDIEKMVSITSDPPQDICNHAMSQILSETSRRDMAEFMLSFNEIVEGAIYNDDTFYSQRGIKIYNVRIIKRNCKDPATEQTFNEIIKAKANQIKNSVEQETENQVRFKKLEGDIRAEELAGRILTVRKQFARDGAKIDGESEADKIAHFITNLPEKLTTEQQLAIYFDHTNTQRLQHVTQSGALQMITQREADINLTNVNYKDFNPNTKVKPVISINPKKID